MRKAKKIVYDQIRENRGQKKDPSARSVHEKSDSPAKVFKTRIWIRQKWYEVLYAERMAWSKFRRYLKRKFKLRQFRWSFEESVGEKRWCHKLTNPFTIDSEKRYRIALHDKLSRKPHLGKQLPNMSKEQGMRPNSRGARLAPANPFVSSQPPAEDPAPCDPHTPAPSPTVKLLPAPRFETRTSPSVA
jgi:hypothetical protein